MSVSRLYTFSVLILLAVTIFGCGQKGQPLGRQQGPVAVTVTQTRFDYAPYYEEYPGTVRAVHEVELRPQVNGYITDIHFREGDKVRKGQKLYTIDQQQSQAAYNQALANLAVQEANLEKAAKDLDRYKALGEKDAIARQQIDYAESAYVSAKQQVEAARAAVQSVQTNVRYSIITAPFDGTIGISQVKIGAAVSPGQTLLNTISSDDPIYVEVAVSQSEVFRYTQMLAGKPAVTDSTFRLVIGKARYDHSGKLAFIDRAVDPQTGTIRMRVEFPNPDHMLRPGMTARLQILTNGDKKSVTIPFKAVTEQLGEFFVYVSDGAKVNQRRVKLGKQIGADIIVESGLTEGETVVVQGVQNLREGSAITASAPAASSN